MLSFFSSISSTIKLKLSFVSSVLVFGLGYMNYIYSKINLKLNKDDLQSWAREVKKRDKVCQICGTSKNLEAHHKWDKSSFPFLAFATFNGVALCKKHHKGFHKWRGGYHKITTPFHLWIYKILVKLKKIK